MKTLVLATLTTLTAAGLAMAQPADPDADSSGLYFAEDAGLGTWCEDAAPGSTLTVYLCLTRGSDTSGYVYWEGRVEVSTGGSLSGFAIRGGGVNAASAPEFAVTWDTPLPYDPSLSTVVMEMDLLVGWEYNIGLRIWPAAVPSGPDPLPVYKTAGAPDTFVSLGYSNGWNHATGEPNWLASVNDANCLDNPTVANEDASWGEVKALYR